MVKSTDKITLKFINFRITLKKLITVHLIRDELIKYRTLTHAFKIKVLYLEGNFFFF